MSKRAEDIGNRLKELTKKMERIKTESQSRSSSPVSPLNESMDAVSDFLDSKRNAQKAKIIHLQDIFNEWAEEENDFLRIKNAMDFAEMYADDFAKIIEVNQNGKMKKRIACDLYESHHSEKEVKEMHMRSLTKDEVNQIIEVLITVSKGDRKFNTLVKHIPEEHPADPVPEPAKHKHRFSTWNKATKAASKH